MSDIVELFKKSINKQVNISKLLTIFLDRGNFSFGTIFRKEKSTLYKLVKHINKDLKNVEDKDFEFISPKNDNFNIYVSNDYKTGLYKGPHSIQNIIIIPITISDDIKGALCLGNRTTKIKENIINKIADLIGVLQVVLNIHCLKEDYKKIYSDSTYFSKDLFLANMSHEIRTPLNGIIGYNQLLMKTSLNSIQQGYLNCMSSCGLQLMNIINDVLDFSKLASGNMPVDKECFSISDAADIVCDTVKNSIISKKISLDIKVAKGIPRYIISDKKKYIQILINLLSNAIKFSHIEGKITVNVTNDGNFLKTEIADNGIGISKKDIPLLFNSFSQPNKSLTAKGTGLGLAISKRLVELLGGTIEVKSQKGEGSVFSFTCKHYPYDQFEKSIRKNAKILYRKYILVVDDNLENRLSIGDMLFEWKMKPIICSSGLEALKLITDNRYNFELALLDICMPDISGIELAAKIKKDKPLFPLIALSSLDKFVNYSDFEVKLDKPVNRVQLFNAIYNIISRNLYNSVYTKEEYSDSDDSFITKSCDSSVDFNKNVKILLIEDIKYNQDLLIDMLTFLEYKNIQIANDGLEAVKMIIEAYETKQPFELLLMDLLMPKMNGYEVIDHLKNNNYKLPPIIVVSASVLEEDKKRCAEYGIKYFINKPIIINDLKYAILNICGE